MGGEGQIRGALRRRLGRLPLLLQDRLLQKLEVHVVAHAHHIPALLRPQEVPRPPDLQVPHGDFEAGPELHVLLDGGEALGGDLREDLPPPEGHVGVGPPGAAPDAPPDLVELAESHLVRVLNNQCIHIGDVNAGLNDGGAHQYLRLPVHHALHGGADLLLVHLPVADDDPHLRPQELLEAGGGEVDGLHPVVQIVDLSPPLDLPADGVGQDTPVVL